LPSAVLPAPQVPAQPPAAGGAATAMLKDERGATVSPPW